MVDHFDPLGCLKIGRLKNLSKIHINGSEKEVQALKVVPFRETNNRFRDYDRTETMKMNFCSPNLYDPADIYMFKVNNRNTRTKCEICSKLIIKTPERRQ